MDLGDIIFNVESPLSAPDVIFGAEDDKFLPFLMSGDPSKSPMHSLSNWNSKDPSRLLNLILQLRFILLQKFKSWDL